MTMMKDVISGVFLSVVVPLVAAFGYIPFELSSGIRIDSVGLYTLISDVTNWAKISELYK